MVVLPFTQKRTISIVIIIILFIFLIKNANEVKKILLMRIKTR